MPKDNKESEIIAEMKLINIGYGNSINEERIVAAVTADSAPAKRMISAAKERGVIVDASSGKKTKTVLVMDSGHIILSAKNSDVIFSADREGDLNG